MRPRILVIGLAAPALMLCLDGGRGPAERLSTPHAAATTAAVDAAWWAGVEQDLRRAEYDVTWQERTCLPGLARAYHAPNRAQDLRTYFTPDGFRMTSRTQADAGWEWGLRLAAYGFAGATSAPAAAALAPRGNRIEYRRGALIEWYVNDERGMEQGFTLASAPPTRADVGAARLVFELAVVGNVTAAMRPDGAGLEVRSREGAHVVDYSGLIAHDADGRDLPAAMVLADGGATVRLEVEASGARYPVTVDPLATTPSWSTAGGQAGMALGTSVAAAGDVNGDGFGDVIVGAPYSDDGQADEGEALLFLGTASGLSSSAAWWVWSDRADARLGFSVATAGDVNGDGFSDIIVGAPGDNGYASNGGQVFVWHGSAKGLEQRHDLSGVDWATYSSDAGDQYGFAVGTAGDVNGDGYSDITFGAPFNDPAGVTDAGTMFVLAGSATGVSTQLVVMYKSQVGAHTGWSVGTAGDFNGDGYADVLLSAPGWDVIVAGNDRGAVTILFGPDLNSGPYWDVVGAVDQGQFGYAATSAGDVNGDGYGDVLIGAPGSTNGQGAEGQAFLYLGAAAPSTTSAWMAESNQAAAHLGKAIAPAGDVNGDGYGDILIGAPDGDYGMADEGAAFAWFGSASGLGADGVPTNADWRVEGDMTDARFGSSLFLAGDVNGDGYSDIVVGAPNYTSFFTGEGAAFVYQGAPAGPGTTMVAWGTQAGGELGYAVAGAGDVNGDGYADVIVSAPLYDNGQADEGVVRVYLGAADWTPSDAYWLAESNEASAMFGASVGRAGDVNGDGYDDIIVGAPTSANGHNDEGRAFVWLGSASGLGVNGNPTNADWHAESNQVLAHLGRSVGTAGDVNGDGFADIVIGAESYDNGWIDEGAIFVWYGSETGLGTPGTPLNADWFAEAGQDAAFLGLSAATAGDVNGDGYSDVIAGAPYYDGAVAGEGAAFIWTGSPTGLVPHALPTNAAWSAYSGQASAVFGYSVASAGDVDGDGYSDVIVGAPYYDGGQTDEGRVSLYLGGAAGVAASPVLYKEIDQAAAHLGWIVGSAGDADGDGFADIFYTAPDYDGTYANSGLMVIRYGPVERIATGAQFTYPGYVTALRLGWSAAGVGDVNGDGFADMVTGAPFDDFAGTDAGAFYFHAGGGGANRAPRPRQYDVSAGGPIAWLGQSAEVTGFRVGGQAFTPFGRSKVKLECEAKPPTVPLDGAGTTLTASWIDTGLDGVALTRAFSGLVSGRVYHWRARIRYSPAACPFQRAGRWFTIPWGGWNEALVRVNTALVDVPEGPAAGVGVSLAPPVPNPFGGVTTIRFTLPAATAAALRVYDVGGRLVRELLDTPRAEAGQHALAWDGRNAAGRYVAPGVYFARLATPDGEATTRLVRTSE